MLLVFKLHTCISYHESRRILLSLDTKINFGQNYKGIDVLYEDSMILFLVHLLVNQFGTRAVALTIRDGDFLSCMKVLVCHQDILLEFYFCIALKQLYDCQMPDFSPVG